MKKWLESGKNSRILNGLWFGSGFTGFEIINWQLTRWGRVSEVGTHIRPTKSSDRVAVGQTQAGRTSWASCQFPWTPLDATRIVNIYSYLISIFLSPHAYLFLSPVCLSSPFNFSHSLPLPQTHFQPGRPPPIDELTKSLSAQRSC